MGKTIFITEKPSVARDYAKVLKISGGSKKNGYMEGYSDILNKDVQITWAIGHLIALGNVAQQNEEWDSKNWKQNKKNLPMIPSTYKYFPQKQTYDQYKIVKSLYTASGVECIYYAGDSGREGIYIQALIRNQIFGGKKPKCEERVVWIDSQTEDEILRGIREAKPYEAYQNMIDSGYERAISDWLIGMNFTQAFTVTSGALITTGRVMTPTLGMIVRLQEQIDRFQKTNYFGFKASKESPLVDAKWKTSVDGPYADKLYNESGFLKREEAEKILNILMADARLTVEKTERKEKKENAPLLFNLADLQGFCSKAFHISPAETLSIVQELYEAKLTTYPRTDSRFLTNAVAKEIEGRIGTKVPSRYVDDSKVTDHYALIPTGREVGGLSGIKQAVYNAIYLRFQAIFMPPYVYDAVTTVYVHPSGERFYENAVEVKDAGYRQLYNELIHLTTVKQHKRGEVITGVAFSISEMETKPPAPYTTGSLVLAMEKAGKLIEDEELREQIKACGIGTSATRAGIIEKLEDKKYITIDKKTQKITPTVFGKSIIPVIERFDSQLVSPEKTAFMEQMLQDIADGKMSREEYTEYINKYITDFIKRILSENTEHFDVGIPDRLNTESIFGKCPKCSGEIKNGKYGYYCVNKCGMNLTKVYGKDLTDRQLASLLFGKSVTMTTKNGKKIKVLPEITENIYQGKTYFNWKTEAFS